MPIKNSDIEKTLRRLPSPSPAEIESARSRIMERLNTDDGRAVRYPLADYKSSDRIRRRSGLVVAAVSVMVLAFVSAFFLITAGGSALLESTNGNIAYCEVVHSGPSGDVVRLADSTRIEMRAESELQLERVPDGVRIRLNHGGVIVNAAKQMAGRHLYVQTKDVLVSVVGTVFLVGAEEKGSRVAVFEGAVHIQQGSLERKLLSGEQMTTNPAMPSLPVEGEIAWSRQAATHIASLQQSAPRDGGIGEPLAKPAAPGFSVSGRVIQSPGTTLQFPSVVLREVIPSGGSTREERESRLLAQRVFQTGIRQDGRFAFSNIPMGSYSLDFTLSDGASVAVNVMDRDVTEVRLVLPPKTSAEGHIVMDDGSPLPDTPTPVLWVLSAVRGRTLNPVTSSHNGSFQVLLYEGDNQINVDPLPRGYSIKSISYGGQELKPGTDPPFWGPIQLDGPAKDLRITLSGKPAEPLPSFRVRGKATNLPAEYFDGTPRMLRLVRKGGLPPFLTELIPDGSFEFPKVEQGVYWLALETGPPSEESIRVRDADIDHLNFDLQNNPFPEYARNRGEIFASGPERAFEGTLTQGITVIKSSEGPSVGLGAAAPDITYQAVPRRPPDDYYFRIAVESPAPGMPRTLAVLLIGPTVMGANLEKLKAGTRVRMVLRPAKHGDSRWLLVPQTAADAVAGVVLINK